jgi:hypothetical protein
MENELSGVALKGSLRRSDRVRRLGLQGCDARLRDEVQEKLRVFMQLGLRPFLDRHAKVKTYRKKYHKERSSIHEIA